jgi:hypothetical protein
MLQVQEYTAWRQECVERTREATRARRGTPIFPQEALYAHGDLVFIRQADPPKLEPHLFGARARTHRKRSLTSFSRTVADYTSLLQDFAIANDLTDFRRLPKLLATLKENTRRHFLLTKMRKKKIPLQLSNLPTLQAKQKTAPAAYLRD